MSIIASIRPRTAAGAGEKESLILNLKGNQMFQMKKRIQIVCLLVLCGLVLSVSDALAQTWDETIDGGGDAGHFLGTAQVLNGVGAVTSITGTMPGPYDVDMYRISITNASTFSASSTAGLTYGGPLMYLFDLAGNGISGYKDATNTTGALISDTFVVSPGVYNLALSGFSSPITVNDLDIWNPAGAANTERAPDGVDAGNPLDDWGPSIVPVSFDSYTITLTGAGHVPEPASMAILALGGMGILRKRKRMRK